jgi:hypothetical protein
VEVAAGIGDAGRVERTLGAAGIADPGYSSILLC